MRTLTHRAEMLSNLFETASAMTVEQPLEESLDTLAHVLQENTPFQVVLISLVDAETKIQQRVAGAGVPVETFNAMKTQQQPWDLHRASAYTGQ